MNDNLTPFMNPAAVASYGEETPKKVPGLADLHRMTALLLAEREPGPAHMLVVGAGGGLELKFMAQARPNWRFTGVDPSPAMLDLARQTTSPFADRIALLAGTVDQAPSGPFNGATCLLTLHFLDRNERLHTLKEIHRRLKPGSVLVIAHHTSPSGDPERWLARSAAFASHSGTDRETAETAAKAMADRLPLLSPAAEEELLREANFVEPALFYAAFSFRGWVAIAGQS
ncbi:class I SAM-dependent methyltransferase [Aquamicrobium sp. LC103]|uniref:class I SAM-dependent methyltransferase n=1 Tax=Aquamicrobium sp. LC103 TaxID=1120658 RepID=UPI00063EA6E7|nr:class I SAM-dependent methyltransferase [Aquamicrobium sp. LC103]TKT69472.1 class I SAM-dependent methyltransferase [Aquamicrobium sp. LC103]